MGGARACKDREAITLQTFQRPITLQELWGEVDGQCDKPCRASQRGLVSGEVGDEAFHTEARGEVEAPGDSGHGRQAAANRGGENPGSDI